MSEELDKRIKIKTIRILKDILSGFEWFQIAKLTIFNERLFKIDISTLKLHFSPFHQ
jgi:hypothetical protein